MGLSDLGQGSDCEYPAMQVFVWVMRLQLSRTGAIDGGDAVEWGSQIN